MPPRHPRLLPHGHNLHLQQMRPGPRRPSPHRQRRQKRGPAAESLAIAPPKRQVWSVRCAFRYLSRPEYQSGALSGQVTNSRAVYGSRFELVRDRHSSPMVQLRWQCLHKPNIPLRRPMDCCDHRDLLDPHRGKATYRRVLWAVLTINAVMFAVEIGAGLAAGSAESRPPFSPSGGRGAYCCAP
jgi:hypothetical protein